MDEAKKFYSRYIKFLKKENISIANFGATLVYWSHSEQYHQVDSDETDVVLKELAKLKKNSCLPSERIFYLNEGYFLVLGPVHNQNILDELNNQSLTEMSKVNFNTDNVKIALQFQLTDLIITKNNFEKYEKFDSMTKN